jgi:hypothetical protein
MVQQIADLTRERDGLRGELETATRELQALRDDVARLEVPEGELPAVDGRPPRTLTDTLRARIHAVAAHTEVQATALAQARSRAAVLQRRADSLRTAFGEAEARHAARLAEEERRATRLLGEVDALTARTRELTAEVERIAARADELDRARHRGYYVAGTREELLRRGIVREEGGARVILGLFWKRGETLVPSRTLDPAAFTAVDIREAREIPLPRAGAAWRIVSAQDLRHLETPRGEGGLIRADVLRIADPEGFWRSAPFLILVQAGG